MLKKLDVPTHMPKDFLLKYINCEVDLEIPPKPKKRHTPYFSNILCKFFVKNSCVKGNECIFSHDLSQFLCSDMASGRECSKADCVYKHDEILAKSPRESGSACSPDDSARSRRMFVSPFALE